MLVEHTIYICNYERWEREKVFWGVRAHSSARISAGFNLNCSQKEYLQCEYGFFLLLFANQTKGTFNFGLKNKSCVCLSIYVCVNYYDVRIICLCM